MTWGWLEGRAADVPAGDAWLAEAEKGLLGPAAVPARRSDWRLGRWTAKRALAGYLGLPATAATWPALAILPDAAGAPLATYRSQPLRVSLSISHRAERALAVVGAAGVEVGCDLERIEARSPAFVADFLTGAERQLWAAHTGAERDAVANRIWSAKESVLKAVGEGLRRDTRSVEVDVGHRAEALGDRWTTVLATDLEGATAYTCWARRLGVHLAVVAVGLGATATASPEPLVGGWAS